MDAKKDSSSRRPRDVIEFTFTCEIVMLSLCPCVSPELVEEGEVEGDCVLTEAARRPEPGDGNVGSSSATGNGAAVGRQ